MTNPSERQPDESPTAWGIRQVREAGEQAAQARIRLALAALFNGRHCTEGDAGCVCALGSRRVLRVALEAVVGAGS